jgi:predicted Zn-dependent protease
MKSVACALVVSAALLIASPANGADANWRQRMSAKEDGGAAASDVAEEIRFGREVAARIIGRFGLYENPPLVKYVNLVGQALVTSANRPELDFHFAILNTDEINAYAAPGGYIFVTRGALQKMQDEAELAGVLAHELGHVIEKHVVKELNIRGTEDSAASGLARVIGGKTDTARVAFAQAVDKALDILFQDGLKREDETQADRDAAVLCALSGYDPTGLTRYFERLNSVKGKQTEVLDKTHPPLKTRIARLKDAVALEGIDSGDYRNNKKRFVESMNKK